MVDNNDTLYITATNRGVNYFTDGIAGHKATAPHTIQDGFRNGTIIAMDLKIGKVAILGRISTKNFSIGY